MLISNVVRPASKRLVITSELSLSPLLTMSSQHFGNAPLVACTRSNSFGCRTTSLPCSAKTGKTTKGRSRFSMMSNAWIALALDRM